MPKFTPRAVIAAGLAATVGVAIPTIAATGTSSAQPANKAVASGSNVQDLQPLATGTKIMNATIKTSKPEDLLMSVSLECSIITNVFVPGSTTQGGSSSGEASGAIKVWLTIDGSDTNPDQNIVPITDSSQPPQDPSQQKHGTDADKVTFCDRDHQVTIKDAESPQDGTDALTEYQFTKSANDFNWVRLNAGSGTHTIRVWAQFLPSDPNDPQNQVSSTTNTNGSFSNGFVGNRTLTIEPTKLANNADMSSAL